MLSVASVSPNLVSASVLRKLLFNVTIPENEMLPSASSASEYAMSSTDLQFVSSQKPRVLSVQWRIQIFIGEGLQVLGGVL